MVLPRQLEHWLEFTRGLLGEQMCAFPRRRVAEELARTYSSQVSWNWFDAAGDSGFDLYAPIPGWPPPDLAPLMPTLVFDHPLLVWFRVSGDLAPQSVARVPRELVTARSAHWVVDVLEPIGADQQLSIPYRYGRTTHRAFVLARAREDYSAEELRLAGQIQTLLMMLDRHCQVLREAASCSMGGPLTSRELVVLRLLGQGLTAEAMAHQLRISVRTVHTHLRSCYRKLGVCDRLQAVLVAQEAGLFRAPAAVAPEVGDAVTMRVWLAPVPQVLTAPPPASPADLPTHPRHSLGP